MKVLTACAEAILVVALFALFTLPFVVMNGITANPINFTTIAQNFSK